MKILRILPALLLFSFIGWVIVQANKGSNNIFFELVRFIPYGDKLGHFILFGTLSLLTVIAFNYKYVLVYDYRLPIGAIIVFLLAIAEEMTQLFLSNRSFDMADISADIAGIFIFMLVFNKFRTAKACKP
ncbi:MAG: VanZ family protein [Colwellia sp.]|nr:VanZ family protein [Colwellia sp.]